MQHDHYEIDIIINEDDCTAIDQLAEHSPFSRQLLKQIMQKGAVWLSRNHHTSRLRRAKKKLKKGDVIHLYYDEQVLNEEPQQALLIADETDYSIWYKPYGMRSQGSKWGDHTTIYRYAEQNLKPQRPAFLVHRLDRAATGLIILAHSKTTANTFARMFEHHNIKKHYRVIVQGKFPDTPQHLTEFVDNKPASSFASLLAYDESKDRSLLDVVIETGRKHQIRSHLSEAGYPVVGDRLYGNASIESENLQLTCNYLAFISPIDEIERSYQLPDELIPQL